MAFSFGLREAGTTVRTELLAGLTTWLAMVYIVAVNPGILATTGMDHGALFVATCLGAGIASIAMGLYANYPLALAPGMGLNAYFAFAVVGGMKMPWQVALGAVFLSGMLFLAVSLLRVREWLINSIPLSLKLGIGAGIGFFLALIGLEDMGLVVANPATLVTLGHVDHARDGARLRRLRGDGGAGGARRLGRRADRHPGHRRRRHPVRPDHLPRRGRPAAFARARPSCRWTSTARSASGLVSIVLTFFLVDVLDNAGTLIATTHRAGLMRPDGTVPRLRQALTADSGGAMLGSMLGTSTVTSYIESAAGIQVGGRTGLTAVITGVLFLATLFFAPLATRHPELRHRAGAGVRRLPDGAGVA